MAEIVKEKDKETRLRIKLEDEYMTLQKKIDDEANLCMVFNLMLWGN